MPEISRFFGIIIKMFHDDHPPPHFHVEYGDHRAIVNIRDLVVAAGELPPRVLGMVLEWAAIHRDQLLEQFERAKRHEPLERIAPLE